MKILYIEDDPADIRLLKKMLGETSDRFSLYARPNLQQALDYLKSATADVVLLGVNSTGGEMDSLKGLLSHFPNLPVIVVTARENEEVISLAIQLGAQDFLIKEAMNNALLRHRLPHAIERQKNIQDLRQRSLDLEMANKELEAFSYSVSHDLRAPLRAMDGYSHALLEDYGEKLDIQGTEWLHSIRTSCRHMSELIDDILSLSRVIRSEMVVKNVDLSNLALSIVNRLKAEFPSRRVECVIQAGVEVSGDSKLLRIALENLLGNAFKFTSKKPEAKIEFGKIFKNDIPVYFVQDNGAGFNMEHKEKLFRPFERLHDDGDFPGTGIGLATVQRIITRHGGRVWGEGIVDRGAVFCFTLGQTAGS